MKKFLTLFSLALAACLSGFGDVCAQQLAFPGADGYGKYVTGGRGGEVCYVTRLDDCSDDNLVPGTLRWALRHDNGGKPRTVLFSVSGTIYLTSKLKLQYPDVSILGQSAPGGGICVAGYNMYICRNNVIVRYIRFRAGDIPNSSMTGLDLENADNVIIDHCSMTWSMEECLTAYDTDYTTIQWCIIGEGLYNSKNSKGARAYATQWGGEHSTMHHSLITNSHSRAPRFNGVRSASTNKGDHDYKVDSEFANNVVYNWSQSGNQYGGEYDKSVVEAPAWAKSDPGYNRVYLFNNYYRPGPSTKNGTTGGRYF
ncbi:MAG: Por secretion system protein, partial [Prevotella sp.]|nr:Por secretion system protein [Prevotella sp.]